VETRSGCADFDIEYSHGAYAQSICGRYKSVAQEVIGELLLAAGMHVIAAEFVVLALLGIRVTRVLRVCEV